MSKPFRLLLALAFAWPAAANAQTGGLMDCDDAGADLISLAADEHGHGIRSFYQGQVTLFELNTEEPAAAPAGIAVVMPHAPVENEPLYTACWAMVGYGRVDIAAARSSYDSSSGLTLIIPTMAYDADRNRYVAAPPIRLRINATRGTIVDLDAQR